MPETNQSPEGNRKNDDHNTNPDNEKTLGRFLSRPWWAGIGGISAILAIAGTVAAVIQILPASQTPKQSTLPPVNFNNLTQITTPRYGLVFYYPTGWDQQDLPGNNDGLEFVNPDSGSVNITGFGSHLDVKGTPTIYDAEKEWKEYIQSLKGYQIVSTAESGSMVKYANNAYYPVDGWRVIYRHVDDHGHSLTDMMKVVVANGREVDLIMEAPTSEFLRYEQAFLQLSGRMLLLAQCGDCTG